MKPTTHRHRAQGEPRFECYGWPVSDTENPAAHGGVCKVDTCRCGAQRRTNINGRHVERGAWVEEATT